MTISYVQKQTKQNKLQHKTMRVLHVHVSLRI